MGRTTFASSSSGNAESLLPEEQGRVLHVLDEFYSFKGGHVLPLESLSPLRRGPPPGEKSLCRFQHYRRLQNLWQVRVHGSASRGRAEP